MAVQAIVDTLIIGTLDNIQYTTIQLLSHLSTLESILNSGGYGFRPVYPSHNLVGTDVKALFVPAIHLHLT